MTQKPNIDETMLHAYVDGELDAKSVQEVEDWLSSNPDELMRVESWKRQAAALHDHFDPILQEPISRAWVGLVSDRGVGRVQEWVRPALAAGIAFATGLFVGLSQMSDKSPLAPDGAQIAHQAASAHIVYAAEVRHPVEVPASEEDHLVGWLSKRLGHKLVAPDLTQSGYDLIGGRLLADDNEPAAQFMYEHMNGQRITLYVTANPADGETAFRIASSGSVTSFYWLNGPLGFALTGEIQQSDLLPIAQSAYEQLNL